LEIKKEKKRLINLWNTSKEYYNEGKFVKPEGTFKQILQLSSDANYILDVGSGLARLSNFIDSNYIGIDISKLALNSAQNNLHTHLINADAENLPLRNKIFDSILIINTLEHMFAPKSVLKESYRVCKSKGIIILHGPAYDFPIACPPAIISYLEKKERINLTKIRFYLLRIKNYISNLFGIDNMNDNIIEYPNPIIKEGRFIPDSDVVYLVRIKEIINYLRCFPGKIKYVRRGKKWYNKFKFSKYWFSKLFLVFERK